MGAIDTMLFHFAGSNPADDAAPGREHSLARVRAAYIKQQPAPVPDQLAIVWRMDLGRILSELTHKRAFFDYYTKGAGHRRRAGIPVVVPGRLWRGLT